MYEKTYSESKSILYCAQCHIELDINGKYILFLSKCFSAEFWIIFNVQIQSERGSQISCKRCVIAKLRTYLIFISEIVVHCVCVTAD